MSEGAPARTAEAKTHLRKTEYFLIFEGTGRFEIAIPRLVQVVKSISVIVSGKVNVAEAVRFFNRKGSEFLAVPVGMVIAHGLLPLQQINPMYTRVDIYGFAVTPANVTVLGWGRSVTKAKEPERVEKEVAR